MMSEPLPGEQPIVQVRNLRVQFGALVAVNDVSFDLRGGDLVGLIGPNGAGKTTLLRTMSGLQAADAGSVSVLGQSVRPGAGAVLGQIGFTPDNPPAYDELTVRQFLRFVARGYDLTGGEIDERIDFWLEKVWLSEKANQKIKQLSRGMRQRLGIARTLLPNPLVILLDEPAAGLDPAGRVQFRQLLCDLRQQGKAMMVSSHILSDMDEYCTHIAIMSAGSIVRFGTVRQVAAHADEQRCRYTLIVAEPVAALGRTLASIEAVTSVQGDHDTFTLEYSADRKQAARLLAELIARGIPVASFMPHAPDLEEAYLRAGVRQVD